MRRLSLLLLFLFCPSAFAMPSDDLALGLGKLRWNMSPQDAETQYPFIKTTTRHPLLFPLTNLRRRYIDDYAYGGCEFSGVLNFNGDKLYSVELTKTAPAMPAPALPCRSKIESEFSSHYGVEIAYHSASKLKNSHWYPFSGFYGDYRGLTMAAHYQLWRGMEISFRDNLDPHPPTIIYDVQQRRPEPAAPGKN